MRKTEAKFMYYKRVFSLLARNLKAGVISYLRWRGGVACRWYKRPVGDLFLTSWFLSTPSFPFVLL